MRPATQAALPIGAPEEEPAVPEVESFADAYREVRREMKNYFSSTMVSDSYWKFINPRLQRLYRAAAKSMYATLLRRQAAENAGLRDQLAAVREKAKDIACNGLFPEARLAAQEILEAGGDPS